MAETETETGLENDRRGRAREHPKRHFLSKGPTRADIAQLPVFAHSKPPPSVTTGCRFITSLPVKRSH